MTSFFASLLLLTSALALGAESPQGPAPSATEAPEKAATALLQEPASPWRLGSRNRIYGVVGMEAALTGVDGDIEDVTMISAQYQRGVDAPTRSYLEHREGQWNRAFGRRKLLVRHERVANGQALHEVTAVTQTQRVQGFGHEKREYMCTRVEIRKQRPLELLTWDDQARDVIGESDIQRRSEQTAFFLVDGEDTRTAMIHLAPGESATVVEVFQNNRSKHSRKIEVQRGNRTLTMVEMETNRTVCLEF